MQKRAHTEGSLRSPRTRAIRVVTARPAREGAHRAHERRPSITTDDANIVRGHPLDRVEAARTHCLAIQACITITPGAEARDSSSIAMDTGKLTIMPITSLAT